ncbi:putative pyruvate kinase, cytosolic isozyme-like isoform 2 [Capsicum annuum]|nr:putative pyruvate kinase, cytosolic isozyme-like isoform 2 [Capsicum annuum]
MTKIVGILGPKSRSVEVISSCLEAGMSGDNKYHQETLDNLKTSIKSTKKLCAAVKKGYILFIGQYLFIGNEMTSVWLKVDQVKGDDVVCVIKNSAMLTGSLFTLHAAQIHIDLPTLPDNDKETRELLGKLGDLSQTQIFAKIESEKACNSLLSMVIYVGLDAF